MGTNTNQNEPVQITTDVFQVAAGSLHSLFIQDMDTDNDGMYDDWEVTHFGNILKDGTEDYDSDNLIDLQEYQNGTNPTVADTDGEGLNDGNEVNTYRTDPTLTDTEGDGI